MFAIKFFISIKNSNFGGDKKSKFVMKSLYFLVKASIFASRNYQDVK